MDTVASPGGGPHGLAFETPSTSVVADNKGVLWSEVEGGVRIPIDRATHTNEPPGFTGGWLERVDLESGRVASMKIDEQRLRGEAWRR